MHLDCYSVGLLDTRVSKFIELAAFLLHLVREVVKEVVLSLSFSFVWSSFLCVGKGRIDLGFGQFIFGCEIFFGERIILLLCTFIQQCTSSGCNVHVPTLIVIELSVYTL